MVAGTDSGTGTGGTGTGGTGTDSGTGGGTGTDSGTGTGGTGTDSGTGTGGTGTDSGTGGGTGTDTGTGGTGGQAQTGGGTTTAAQVQVVQADSVVVPEPTAAQVQVVQEPTAAQVQVVQEPIAVQVQVVQEPSGTGTGGTGTDSGTGTGGTGTDSGTGTGGTGTDSGTGTGGTGTNPPTPTLSVATTDINSNVFAQANACLFPYQGSDLSPQITITTNVTATTHPDAKLHIVIEDRDPNRCGSNACIHLNLFNVDINDTSFDQGAVPVQPLLNYSRGTLLQNYNGTVGYAGMCPPPFDPPHPYHIVVLATTGTVNLASQQYSVAAFEQAFGSEILASGSVSGQYPGQ